VGEKRLSRKAVIGSAGGAVVAGSALTQFGADAFAAAQETGAYALGTITDAAGSVAGAVSNDGRRHRGAVQSRRQLRRGDRVVILEQPDGSVVIQPMYVGVAGVVDSVDRKSIVVEGQSYAIDRASIARRSESGRWVEAGAIGDVVRRGTPIEALAITNADSGTTAVSVAWI
jgi:hypothetical protein